MSRQRQRIPKRIVYCSDGVIEEFSSSSEDTDEEEEDDGEKKVTPAIDPQTLPWAQWAIYCAKAGLSSSFRVAEYVGGRIADFVGITAPIYKYEIEEYYRMQEEERALRRAEAEECRTRKREHEMVSSAHPFFISMSNDRTVFNAGIHKTTLKSNFSRTSSDSAHTGHSNLAEKVQYPSEPTNPDGSPSDLEGNVL